mmetsp:Transcript_22981/g.58488  ORF Transcript_22981/g.58488 Transcript_22981/m.58488 type:complete len:211 (+) Transcript_22981:846-1478(+)
MRADRVLSDLPALVQEPTQICPSSPNLLCTPLAASFVLAATAMGTAGRCRVMRSSQSATGCCSARSSATCYSRGATPSSTPRWLELTSPCSRSAPSSPRPSSYPPRRARITMGCRGWGRKTMVPSPFLPALGSSSLMHAAPRSWPRTHPLVPRLMIYHHTSDSSTTRRCRRGMRQARRRCLPSRASVPSSEPDLFIPAMLSLLSEDTTQH